MAANGLAARTTDRHGVRGRCHDKILTDIALPRSVHGTRSCRHRMTAEVPRRHCGEHVQLSCPCSWGMAIDPTSHPQVCEHMDLNILDMALDGGPLVRWSARGGARTALRWLVWALPLAVMGRAASSAPRTVYESSERPRAGRSRVRCTRLRRPARGALWARIVVRSCAISPERLRDGCTDRWPYQWHLRPPQSCPNRHCRPSRR